MRYRSTLLVVAAIVAVCQISRAAEDQPFSGPQVGEKLTPFEVTGVLGTPEGQAFDVVNAAGGKPLVIVFVHELTRPGNAVTNLVLSYAVHRRSEGLHSALVFLSDDMTAATERMKRAQHALAKGLPVGVSPAGAEGPGAYGLNRKMTLTVLVAKDNRVTANFALVQPSDAADAPRIAAAIAQTLGDTEPPTIATLYALQAVRDKDLRKELLPVIGKKEALQPKQMEQIKSLADKSEEANKQLAQLANRLAYGKKWELVNPTIARYLQTKVTNRKMRARTRPSPVAQALEDGKLRSIMSPLINKQATPEDVDAAARKIEATMKQTKGASEQIGQIARRIINAGRLENYGTPAAQAYLKKWADKYAPE